MANIYDLVDTWTVGTTTYNAIKMDVTDTASAADSMLMDLLVGGASKFGVTKAGALSVGDAATTRTNLGVQSTGAVLDDLNTLGAASADGEFIVATGAGAFAYESGATARASLGLGSIATQASASVTITGGSITGITDLAVADGGTGAGTAANARTNLGLAIGTDVQAYDAGLASIAGLTTAADKMVYTTASDVYAVTALTAAGRAILDDASASAQRTTLGVAIGTDVQAYDAGLADIAALAVTDGNFVVGDGLNWVAESGATARTSLGLGSIATQSAASVSITGGSVTGITDLAVADGGTGASTAAAARTSLGLVIGTDVQAEDAGLTSIAGLTTAADTMIYTTLADTYATTTLTSAGRALLDDANAAAQRTTLGLAIGTDVQAQGAVLDDLNTLGASAADGEFLVATGIGALAWESGATARTSLGVAIGTDVQAYDAGLADIAGLAVTNGNFIVGNGLNWVAESGATARASLGLAIGTDVQAWDTDLDTYAANPLTAAELGQLQNIGTATVSAAQWGYLGGTDQALATTDNVVFGKVTVGSQALWAGLGGDVSSVFVGNGGGAATTTGAHNIGVGKDALDVLTTGNSNIAIGTNALGAVTTSSNNIAVGRNGLILASTGSANTLVGHWAMQALTTGNANTGVGYGVLNAETTGSDNVAVGRDALAAQAGASGNTGVGRRAGVGVTTGGANSLFGYWAGDSITTGANNVAIGYNVATLLSTGSNNTVIGKAGAATLTTGSNNMVLGSGAEPSSATVSNEITLGDGSVTDVRIPGIGFTLDADSFRISTAKTPATAGATGIAGTHTWDTSYLYVCTATNTWKRAALATW